MKWFFHRNRDIKKRAPSIEKMMLHVQERLKCVANFLQRRTEHYSARRWRGMVILFCSAFAGISGLTIYNSFKTHNAGILKITPIRVFPIERSGNLNTSPVDDKVYLRIHLFKIYLDSLAQTPVGKRACDSFLLARPHLIDTINYLEQIYQHSINTKSYGKENDR